MAARFILSLDCEGKWGVADHLGPFERETLSDARLRTAYGDLLRLLDRFRIPATFAFVGLFGESRAALHALLPELEQLAEQADYLATALAGVRDGDGDGWHGDWAVAAAADAGHEIALHGVTHVPWTSVPRAFAAAELALVPKLSSAVREAKTFIYPRNRVAYPDLLASHGIAGYRLAKPKQPRALALLDEVNLLAPPDPDPEPVVGEPVRIPAGHFVNWQHGARRIVPRRLSLMRVEAMLDRAQASGGVVHLWLHPENLASAPKTFDLLAAIVAAVARRRDAGRCEVLTQIAYVRSRSPAANG